MLKLDVHTHTNYSDGFNSPKEMVDYAKKIGFDGIAITDHNEIKGTLEAKKLATKEFQIITGIEVTADEGHILCLGIEENIEKYAPAAEVIEKTHQLGGIAIAAHPYDRLRGGVGDLIYKLKFDAVELYNGHTLYTSKSIDEILEKNRLPVTGGSDAHRIDDIGTVYIETGEDVLDSIKKGNVKVTSDIQKLRIIKGFLKSRIDYLL